MYLLSWTVPFKDDAGYETYHLAYTSKEKAMREGIELLHRKHMGEPAAQIADAIAALKYDRSVDYHYCSGITIQPLKLID